MISDVYNIPIGNVKKLKKKLKTFFDKEKYVLHYENLQLHLKLWLKLKKLIVYSNSIKKDSQKINKAEKMDTRIEKRCTN